MSGIAAYKAQIKLGGIPTNFVSYLHQLNENVFRVSDHYKRVISANHSINLIDFNGNNVEISKVNYLEGVFLINDYLAYTLPLELEAHYIPLLYIGGAKEYTLDIGGDILDDTSFHSETTLSEGFRTKVQGLNDVSLSLSRWNDFSNKLLQAKLDKTPIFVSINPGASKTFISGWYHIETDNLTGDIGALEEEALSLALCGNNTKTYFSYSFNYTDSEAISRDNQEIVGNYFID